MGSKKDNALTFLFGIVVVGLTVGVFTNNNDHRVIALGFTIAGAVFFLILYFMEPLSEFITKYVIAPIGRCCLTDEEIAAAGEPDRRVQRFQIEVL